jgi:hypothetical protein
MSNINENTVNQPSGNQATSSAAPTSAITPADNGQAVAATFRQTFNEYTESEIHLKRLLAEKERRRAERCVVYASAFVRWILMQGLRFLIRERLEREEREAE